MGAEVDGRAAADQDRLEHPERGVGAVGPAGQRGHRRDPGHARLLDQAGARGRDHRARLHEALLELALRDRVGHDAAARAHPDPLAAHLERPDRDVQLQARDRARESDRAGVRLASAGLELGDHPHRLDLRRARDRAGRERGAQEVRVAGLGAQPPAHRRHEVPHARRRLAARCSAGTSIEPYSQTRPRSLRIRSTIITFSARSFTEAASAAASVLGPRALAAGCKDARRRSLDRLGHHLAAAAAEEELGGEAADGAPRSRDHARVARLERSGRAREQVERVALPLRLEPQAEVRLEDLAGGDALAALVDRGHVARSAGRRGLEVADPHGPLADAVGQPRAEQLEPGGQLVRALVASRAPRTTTARRRRGGGGGRRRRARSRAAARAAAAEAERARGARRGCSRDSRTSRRRRPRPRRRPPRRLSTRGLRGRAARTGPRRARPRRSAPTRPALRRPPSRPRARTDARRRARAAHPRLPRAFPRARCGPGGRCPGTSHLSLRRPPPGTRSRRRRPAAARGGA